MLKKIPSNQLRVGMFLHELCGSWMDHPFWRARFVVREAADLHRILECGIKEVWIDIDKGADVEGGQTQHEVAAAIEAELEAAVMAELRPIARPVVKPAAQLYEQARRKVKSLYDEARMGQAIHMEGCVEVVEDIMTSVSSNPGALVSLVRLKTQDEYTYLHSVAVCTLMVALARTLGLSANETRDAGLSGLLHDMGKARIPLEVLNKPGRLTDEEFGLIKKHPEWGHELLLAGGEGVPAMALDVCLNHHEKMDGSGYPHHLAGEAISLFARMGAVCDVYDAITSARAYKTAWDPGEAVRQMAQWKGHFDAGVFQAFVKTVGIYPIGALVKLKSGRLGVVLDQNPSSLLTPRVKVFFSIRANVQMPPEVIDLAVPGCQDRILGVESPEAWKFKNLEALWLDEAKQRR
jgi:HD-GYP domain-containing protein (c-di-GMP phosphodiesterase class II)